MYVLGIDIGTSCAKCLLITRDGQVAGRASEAYPLLVPRPGWAEQDPEWWGEAAFDSIRKLIETTGISAESTMAEVMAYWLVPQLFIAGMIGVVVVKIMKGLYRACRDLCDKLLLRRAARDAVEEKGTGAKEAAGEKPKAGGTAGNGRPRGPKRDAGTRKDDGKRAEDAGSASGGCKDGENAG